MAEQQPEWLKIGVGGVVPVQWDTSNISKDSSGEVSGYASVYNVVDLQDDVVMPGAFKRTINAWKSSGQTIPLVLDHQHDTEGIVGSIGSLSEASTGLKFAAKFSGVAKAQDARTKAVEGHLRGLSVFGPIIHKSYETRNGREIRILHEVGLMEISLTGFPANTSAMVTAVKNMLTAKELDESWVADMKAALAITSPTARKAAVDDLIGAMYSAMPNVGTGAPADQDDGSKDGDHGYSGEDDAAKYALGVAGDDSDSGGTPLGGDSENPLADQLMASVEAETHRRELSALANLLRENGAGA